MPGSFHSVNHSPRRRTDLLTLLAYVAFAAGLGWWLGQDANWDLRNYHLYNVFMLLFDRFERDVHVAGVQTFLNPVLHLPLYFGILHLQPITVGLTLSALHGALLFFVHRIATLVLAPQGSRVITASAVIAAITSAWGAAVHSEIGSSMGDNTIGLLILGALALLMADAHADRADALQASRRAGLVAGLAAGAKLVAGIYVFGLLAAALITPGTRRARISRALHFGVMMSLGFILTGGYWMWLMHQHFGSPLFPFFNGVFGSPFAPPENFSDVHRPETWQATIVFPFYFFSDQYLNAETFFRDGRLAVALVSLAAIAIGAAKRRRAGKDPSPGVDHVRLRQLAAFFVVSYVVWLAAFALYRYAVPLEALSAVLIIACALSIARSRIVGLGIALAICAALVLFTKPLAYERLPWTDSYFGIARDDFRQYHDAVVLLTDFPIAYAVPFFPHSTSFLRISSNWGLEPGNEMWRRLHERIAAAPENRLYWLEIAPYATQAEADTLLKPFNVKLHDSSCDEVATNFEPIRICAVARDAIAAWSAERPGKAR